MYILTTRRDTALIKQLLRRHSVSPPAERIPNPTPTPTPTPTPNPNPNQVSLPAEHILCATEGEGGEGGDEAASGTSGAVYGAAQCKAAALAALRERHATALLRYVDDDADCLRAVAADPRLLSVQLFYAAWGYATEAQRSSVAAMPRVRELRLEPLCLAMPSLAMAILATCDVRLATLATCYLLGARARLEPRARGCARDAAQRRHAHQGVRCRSF